MIEYWQAPNGRWYWHYKVRGRVKADGSYAWRGSVARMARRDYPGIRVVPR